MDNSDLARDQTAEYVAFQECWVRAMDPLRVKW